MIGDFVTILFCSAQEKHLLIIDFAFCVHVVCCLLSVVFLLQVSGYESFANNFYESQGYPHLGVSDFGKGIFGRDADFNRFHDTESPTHGTHNILFPNFLAANIQHNSPSTMLNIYSQNASFAGIDRALDCAASAITGGNMSLLSTCYDISNVMWLIQDDAVFRPAATIYYPLLPEREDSQSEVTGIGYVLFNWDALFSDSIPRYIKGLEIVLSHCDEEVYTYALETDDAIFKGSGQEHTDGNMASRGKKVDVSIMEEFNWPYTITLVPSREYDGQYRSKSPFYASMFSVIIVMITSGLFFFYDHLITRGAREKELVINTRRLFVR